VQVHKGAHPAGLVKELVKRCYHLRAATVDQVGPALAGCHTTAKHFTLFLCWHASSFAVTVPWADIAGLLCVQSSRQCASND
jgi:hypothetical protein